MVGYIIVEICNCRHDHRRCVCHVAERYRTVRHRSAERIAVADRDRNIWRHMPDIRHLVAELLCHLLYDEPSFCIRVVAHQHLPVRERVVLCLVSLDVRHFRCLYAVRVIDHELCVYPEHPEKKILVARGKFSDPAHRRDAYALKLLCRLPPYHPEVGDRLMIPKLKLVFVLVENPDKVLRVLGDYIHRYLCEIEVRTYACRRPDSYSLVYLPHKELRHLLRIHSVSLQI